MWEAEEEPSKNLEFTAEESVSSSVQTQHPYPKLQLSLLTPLVRRSSKFIIKVPGTLDWQPLLVLRVSITIESS